jgi:hypothetical protein
MSLYPLPIETFIVRRLDELGIRPAELTERCGISNARTGLRVLLGVYRGDWAGERARAILRYLPAGLGVEEDAVAAAIWETREAIAREERTAKADREARWRAAFKPHAYLTTEHARPSSITMCAFTGGPDRWLKVPLDLARPPVTYADQALAVAREQKGVPFFGTVIGVTVNYSPDSAVRLDLAGTPIESYPRAYSPAQISVVIGRRPVTQGQIDAMFVSGG